MQNGLLDVIILPKGSRDHDVRAKKLYLVKLLLLSIPDFTKVKVS